jgi:single-strand DNA-binding protein
VDAGRKELIVLPRITLEGRVVADPELRFGQSGTAVCKMRLVAADRRMNKQTNEWEDGDTLWMDVTCFKQLAENVVESVVKGDLVLVTGKIRTEEWEDRESGAKRSKVAMIADTVSASLQFRVIPHGEAKQRATAPSPAAQAYGAAAPSAYGGAPQEEEPPF